MANSSENMASAAQRALAIPHILTTVIGYVDIPTLFNCAHVCRFFREPSLLRLWAGCPNPSQDCVGHECDAHLRTPSVCHLNDFALTSPSTLATYLSFVHYLSIRCDTGCPALHLTFWNDPRLWSNFTARRIKIDNGPPNEASLFPLLHQQLRSLLWVGRSPNATEAIFDMLRVQCPRLTQLTIPLSGFDMTEVDFIAFLGAMPQLTQLNFEDDRATLLTRRSVVRLLARPNLRALSLALAYNISINDEMVKEAQQYRAARYHRNIRRTAQEDDNSPPLILDRVLKLEIGGTTSTLLLAGLRSLRTVKLRELILHEGSSPDIGITILNPLGQCSALEEVEIEFGPMFNEFVTSEDLVDFVRRTPQMADFSFMGLWVMSSRTQSLPAQTLLDMLKGWPRVNQLKTDVPFEKLESSAFYGIPRSNRFLASFAVRCVIDIEHRDNDPDEVFRCLTYLSVDEIEVGESECDTADEDSNWTFYEDDSEDSHGSRDDNDDEEDDDDEKDDDDEEEDDDGDAETREDLDALDDIDTHEDEVDPGVYSDGSSVDESEETIEDRFGTEFWARLQACVAMVEVRMPVLSILSTEAHGFFGQRLRHALQRDGQAARRMKHAQKGSAMMQLVQEYLEGYRGVENDLHDEAMGI